MLKYLLEKEFKQIIRNPFMSRMILMMPIMSIAIFPFVTTQEVRDVKLGIVDYDHSPVSERLVQKAASSDYFQLVNVSPTYQKALQSVEAGQTDLILEIPQDFERDLYRGEETEVLISANSVNGTRAGLGTQYLSSIVNDYSNELREKAGLHATEAEIPTFRTSMSYRFNSTLDYLVFMVPALLIVAITQLCCSLTALNIVGEKESGTIEQINVTPVPKSLFILAKLIPNWLVGFVATLIGVALAWGIHGLLPVGSWLTFVPFVGVYVLFASAFGMVISNYSNTMQQAMFVMFFFTMILLMTCGMFTPIESMPEWAQTCTAVNPLRYFAEVMRLIYLKGSGFTEMLSPFGWLCGFALMFNVWAVVSYKKKS